MVLGGTVLGFFVTGGAGAGCLGLGLAVRINSII